jgi:hypothetical protein
MKARIKSSLFKCISWPNDSLFGGDDWGFLSKSQGPYNGEKKYITQSGRVEVFVVSVWRATCLALSCLQCMFYQSNPPTPRRGSTSTRSDDVGRAAAIEDPSVDIANKVECSAISRQQPAVLAATRLDSASLLDKCVYVCASSAGDACASRQLLPFWGCLNSTSCSAYHTLMLWTYYYVVYHSHVFFPSPWNYMDIWTRYEKQEKIFAEILVLTESNRINVASWFANLFSAFISIVCDLNWLWNFSIWWFHQ